ncbi:hypothetical protein [Pseudomonas sp. ADAK13]|uniref:hypothetical protein n=1 Tax=Pseudomonas sp. ADAK13 TaxID=2730847 RepID=UPI001463CAF8|nr:hypothetical protein [Pseudomonas sp. ADAK13]QJI35964.1 hypothetical protein HKK54_16585 [Pseudomonas sp. ADAK13]
MNEQIFVLTTQKKTTNHILHLLLCIPTFGVWLLVWGITIRSNDGHNRKIDRQISQIMEYKLQGLSDVEAYQRVKSDDANSKSRSDQIFVIVVIVVTVAAFFVLK